MIEPLTCIHQAEGLCPTCRAEFEEDEIAWIEFGQHPAGIANWNALLAEMELDHAANPEIELTADERDEIPF